ncbi:hypothetical protein AKJ17_05900 [Vibrio nereis]|uniref:Uncharacterized protein n=1 Tax=Vibrio nereis TaxID=693 RepID=A0A0M0HRB2_VIBNE|nr:hypothetical protein AKJ17_05900 [Vibrio nereis]KOO10222.1 hypothetical protein AKJ18_35370 [Vibrio xuii]
MPISDIRPIDNPDRVINEIYQLYFALLDLTLLINLVDDDLSFRCVLNQKLTKPSLIASNLIIDNIYHTIDTINLTEANIRNSLDADQF